MICRGAALVRRRERAGVRQAARADPGRRRVHGSPRSTRRSTRDTGCRLDAAGGFPRLGGVPARPAHPHPDRQRSACLPRSGCGRSGSVARRTWPRLPTSNSSSAIGIRSSSGGRNSDPARGASPCSAVGWPIESGGRTPDRRSQASDWWTGVVARSQQHRPGEISVPTVRAVQATIGVWREAPGREARPPSWKALAWAPSTVRATSFLIALSLVPAKRSKPLVLLGARADALRSGGSDGELVVDLFDEATRRLKVVPKRLDPVVHRWSGLLLGRSATSG
jgi:hypothetical protein